MNILKRFMYEEDGLGTVELVLLLAILVGLALMFRKAIVEYVGKILANITKNEIDPTNIESGL
ncbi:hypothetical protein F8154_02750 [Alkaliphilus pronyensis]|uniref:Putative Flagellin Flp1-like domain-containing protein n=1 Tax=Alkaliphilus pronyensis TaxID=1482732 RepID=A0A6I0F2Y8_9FIRM|nr:Flp1 family type IVb pilin [Alkaliphilus pronyensis]KAB3537231.1 hypothetical protein F8154_02750 [Alkaliphilus pronyensis]